MAIIPNEEFIERNFSKLLELIESTVKNDQRKEKLLELFNYFGERYAIAPASSRKEYHSAFPGGLCYHSLHVLQWAGKFAGVMAPNEFSNETILTVAVLAPLGKVGSLTEDYYVPLNSDWHAKKGIFFEANDKLSYMRIPLRSLQLAQHFGINLTEEEYLAILLSEGQNDAANSSYKYREPKLATILSTALAWAQKVEKTKEVQYP